jgi:hypothetical protein
VEVLKEDDKNKINIECFGANKANLLLKIREEFNKIRTLDKATEYRIVNGDWQVFNSKLEQKEVGKSGFDEQPLLQLNEKDEPSLMELLKNDLNKLMENVKVKEVLNRLIEHHSNDLEEQRKARLHLMRIQSNEDEKNQALISQNDYRIESNRINDAVLTMISAL